MRPALHLSCTGESKPHNILDRCAGQHCTVCHQVIGIAGRVKKRPFLEHHRQSVCLSQVAHLDYRPPSPPPSPSSRRVAGPGVPIAGPPHGRTSASVAKRREEICFHVTGRRRPCATREVRLPEICRLPEPWEPLNYRVTQQVYATAWDGNVVVQADLNGNFSPPTTFRGSAPPRDRRPFRFLRRPGRGR